MRFIFILGNYSFTHGYFRKVSALCGRAGAEQGRDAHGNHCSQHSRRMAQEMVCACVYMSTVCACFFSLLSPHGVIIYLGKLSHCSAIAFLWFVCLLGFIDSI